MILLKRINFIKKISLFLFIFSFLSLTLSLWLHNNIVSFNFSNDMGDEKLKASVFYSAKIICLKKDDDECQKNYLGLIPDSKKLGACYTYNYKNNYIVNNNNLENQRYLYENNELPIKKTINLKPEFVGKEIELQIRALDKNDNCIKNSKNYIFYKIFPFYYEFIYQLKTNPKTELGTSVEINPFIHGEASISNIVKRFPINYVFKSFLFVSVIFMYLYWMNYRHLFAEILESKNNKFIYFGIASAIFLFFHVLLLGVEFDSKIIKLIRKLIIAFFILSEIIAQFNLSLVLFKNKEKLNNFCHTYIINFKLLFVSIISLVSLIVVTILLIFNLSSKVDYILEWNYFAGLLFYYLLSFMMWKKQIN